MMEEPFFMKYQSRTFFQKVQADSNMAAVYRKRIDDKRLVAVVNHVHKWLFPQSTPDE